MQPSRFGDAGRRQPTSARWNVERLTGPSRLWGSNGVSFGPDGRLYVAQFLAGRIDAVDLASGDVDVAVPMDGPVQAPDDLAFGADGSMYITDLVPGRVWRRDPFGEYSLVSDQMRVPNGITCVGDRLFVNEMKVDGRLVELFPGGGDPHELAGGLAMGNAMQLGPDGHLYYPHMLTNQVFRVHPDGGAPDLVAEDVHDPVAVRFDRDGVLVVLSRGAAGVVTRIDLFGTGTRSVVASGVVGLDNAAFDDENRMFVSSFASGGIAEMHPDGRTREIVRPGLDGPYGVAVDLGGTVHVADHYRLASPREPDGDEPDDVTTRELLIFSHGIAADDNGLLHLTSQYGDLRSYDPVHRTVRARASGLDRPTGIAAREDGSLVFAETGSGRVLAIDESDAVTVLAEGLEHPVDVALDSEQRCYVSDDRCGAVFRIDEGKAVLVEDGLGPRRGWPSSVTSCSSWRPGTGGCGRSASAAGKAGSTRRTWPSVFRRGSPVRTPRSSARGYQACHVGSPVLPWARTVLSTSRPTARAACCCCRGCPTRHDEPRARRAAVTGQLSAQSRRRLNEQAGQQGRRHHRSQ